MTEHTLRAEPTHSRWNKDLEPRLLIEPGDTVHFECLDSSGGQVHRNSSLADFLAIDRGRIHALTGPIYVAGAESGDLLQVDILEVRHQGWGWSSILPGLGFLKERFTDPYLFLWDLEQDVSRSLAPAVIPLRPFCGVMGVAPDEAGEFRTRPPGRFGGNMDVRELCSGAKLYLPVFNAGSLFSVGDAHASQGDGEVCINGIECPVTATMRFQFHKHRASSGPLIESSPAPNSRNSAESWVVVESDQDALCAARTATSRMIDLISNACKISDVDSYLLCSVAMNLRLSQVVNEPMITVCAALPKHILPGVRLF
jgi:acetamidase/formamidase